MAQPPAISFCMIVRNGAATLRDCLESVVHLVDELVVVDTGSGDDSVSIARSYGARVIEIDWPEDFSRARNAYLAAARHPWVLSLDADEVLPPLERRTVNALIAARPTAAFVFTVRNYFLMCRRDWWLAPTEFGGESAPGIGWMSSHTVRLFPRRRCVTYQYPVHESLVPALRVAGIRRRRSSIPVHHNGYLQAEVVSAKTEMYRRLGLAKIAQHPCYFLGYLELGRVFLRDGELEGATRLFERALRLNPFYVKAYYYAALASLRQGRHEHSRRLWARGRRLFPKHADLLYLGGLIELEAGNTIQAATHLAAAMQQAPQLAALQATSLSEAVAA
jgi:glycosyltransferase involved in cell wall biosynthesis